MKNDFPLIKELGLQVLKVNRSDQTGYSRYEVVLANKLEKLLAEGVRVYGLHGDMPNPEKHIYWSALKNGEKFANQTGEVGLLIGIKPIERDDTAEGLLREWIEIDTDKGHRERTALVKRTDRFLERARRLLKK